MKTTGKVRLMIVFVLTAICLYFYVGRIASFSETVKWHNNNHPPTFGVNGQKIDPHGVVDAGDYYIANATDFTVFVSKGVSQTHPCEVCRGRANSSLLLLKIAWPLFNIDESRNITNSGHYSTQDTLGFRANYGVARVN